MKKYLSRLIKLWQTLRINYDFLLLFVMLLIANASYLARDFFPIHDTLEVFTFFHYFYSEWFINGEIPQWFPYSTYGVPANFYQFRNVAPLYYVFMLLGKIFQVKDALFLFKISVIAEQCVFLLGMYKLSRYLFKRRATVFMVCLAAVSSIVWHSAINFNFRLYAMFPLVAYCLLVFFERHRPGFMWLAGIACLFGGMGVTIYFFGLWAFLYVVLGILLLIGNRAAFKEIFRPTRVNGILFISFVALAGLALWYLKSAIDFVTLVSIDRQASGVTTLETFLNYGNIPHIRSVLRGLFFADVDIKVGVPFDNTVYMGLLPLFFFFWSLLHVRKAKYYIFLTMAALLVWMSFGGLFAALVYRFPALSYYRHIGHVYSLVKILLLICAGYGMDHFWDLPVKKRWAGLGLVLVILFFVFDVLVNQKGGLLTPQAGFSQFLSLWSYMRLPYLGFLFRAPVLYFVLIAFALGCGILLSLFRRADRSRWALLAKGLLILFVFADLMVFQRIVDAKMPKVPFEHFAWLQSARVRTEQYQPYRVLEPVSQTQKDAYELVMLSKPTAKYVSAYNFVQMDRCDPGFRVDLASHGVLELVSIPFIKRPIVGCYASKMRLVPHALFSDDILDVARIGSDVEAFAKVVVLTPSKDQARELVPGHPHPDSRNSVQVTDFSANQVKAKVAVFDAQGSWLV